jgi:steroid 5-alpha reductase family enzyme
LKGTGLPLSELLDFFPNLNYSESMITDWITRPEWMLSVFIAVSGLFTLIVLFRIPAPYGKFASLNWGPVLKSRNAWFWMELPSAVVIAASFVISGAYRRPLFILFFVLWEIHYLYRTFIYPRLLTRPERPFPLLLVIFAVIFNSANGLLHHFALFSVPDLAGSARMTELPFLAGLVLFAVSFILNKYSESLLRRLRKNNPDEYRIPEGGLFRWVSCPHYLTEIAEWTGWALMTGSIAGWAFAFFTFCNLFPRAILQHRWYKNRFQDYPAERKAIVPFIL